MRYYMKSNFFRVKEDFWIKNDSDEDVYFVNRKFFSLGLNFDILKDNNVIYSVKQNLFNILPVYEMIENEKIIAKIKKKFTFFNDKMEVHSDKYGDFIVKGDLFNYNYVIYKENEKIASISKKIIALVDNYYVDISYYDEAFILALVVIIDDIIDSQKNHR